MLECGDKRREACLSPPFEQLKRMKFKLKKVKVNNLIEQFFLFWLQLDLNAAVYKQIAD